MKPLPKTLIKSAKIPAPAAKAVAKALDALDAEASVPRAQALLAAAAKLPFVADGDRSSAEWQALDALINLGDQDAARKVWNELIVTWASYAPIADTSWHPIARAQQALGTTIPAKHRVKVRNAWAWGVLSQVFQYTSGASMPQPRGTGADAWRQGCIEITLQQFERARACVEATRKATGYDYSARCLEIMLLREQGDLESAREKYLELVGLARKKRRYAQWDVIAALFVILGIDDTKIAKEIRTAWRTKRTNGEQSIFEA